MPNIENAELARQVEVLTARGYPARAGLSRDEFLGLAAPLDPLVNGVDGEPEQGFYPFVLVAARDLVPADAAGGGIERRGKPVSSMFEPGELERFVPIEGSEAPSPTLYLITDVESVGGTVGLRPDDAVEQIIERGRSPLTLEEGIALATQFPESVAPNECFQMPASRCGDRRIASIWLSKSAPKLGWCWAGNPHTWLGSASCAARVAA